MKYCEQCQSAYPNDFQVCPRDNAPLRTTSEIVEGMIIANKYAMLERIGMGGMATVYRARHLAFNEIRAIKVLKSRLADDVSVKRFRTEAIIARKLDHPNAVRVDDLDVTADGQPFIVMEYVSGKSLRRIIREEGPLAIQRSLKIACQVADALRAAHELGIVHRDIKPDNVLLTERGGLQDFVKVLDFGIAKVQEGAALSHAADYTTTQTGMVVGTPAYLSPEQARGNAVGEVDGRADLYSLGVVLYEMITGELPFKAEASMDMILHHLHTPATPPHELRPDLKIPRGLSMLLMKAMEKDRNFRFQSAQEMLDALQDPDGALASGKFASQEAQYYEAIGQDRDEVYATGVRGSENYEAAAAAPARAAELRPLQIHAMDETVLMAQPKAESDVKTEITPLPAVVPKPSSAWRIAVAVPLIALATWAAATLYFRPNVRVRIAEKAKGIYASAMRFHQRPSASPAPTQMQTPANLAPATNAPVATAATNTPPPIAPGTSPNATAAQASAAPSKAPAAKPSTSGNSLTAKSAPAAAGPAAATNGRVGELQGRVLVARADPDAEITVELENTGLNYDQSLSVAKDGSYRFPDVPPGRGYTITAFENGEAKDSRSLTVHGGPNRVALLKVPEAAPDEDVRVYGKIYDEQGKPLASALVKLASAMLKVDRGAVTGPDGDYSFTEVPPANDYKLSVVKNNIVLATQAENIFPHSANPEQIVILYLKK